MMARTTNADRLDYLRWMLECIEANIALGRDLEDMQDDIRRAIRRRERQEQPR